MLTKKQKGLFEILGFKDSPGSEMAVRDHYKVMKQYGRRKYTFTRWLEKCVQEKWRRENEQLKGPYLGD